MSVLLRQIAVCGVFVASAAMAWTLAERSMPTQTEAGLWFDPVTFRSVRLGGEVTARDLATIEALARAELASAFAGLPIRFSDRRDAFYRIHVTQEVRDPRFRGSWGVAGASRAVSGLGGGSDVSFAFLAGGATSSAPETAGRDEIIAAIGRGIGRTAVHELTHLLLPQAPIHDSRDAGSYEFDSAARRQQYFGEMHWDFARPLLAARLAR